MIIFKDLNIRMSKTPSNIKKLDDYIGAFYEDSIDTKIQSSKNIL